MTTTPATPDPIAATRKWIERAVIGLNLCPFAKAVYVKDQVRLVLSDASTPEALLEQLAEELVLLRDTPAKQIDTTLIVHRTCSPISWTTTTSSTTPMRRWMRWICKACCKWPASIRITNSQAPRWTM